MNYNKKYLVFIILISVLIGIFSYWLFKDSNTTIENTQTIRKHIQKLSKLIVVEGAYTDVYEYKDEKGYLANLIHFEKKILVVTEAKVQLTYNLKTIDFTIDSINKIVIINKIPKAEPQIITDIHYYDIEDSQLNKFEAKDLNHINKQAIERIKQKAKNDQLDKKAALSLQENIEDFIFFTSATGWKVINQSGIQFSKEKE